MKAFGSQAKEPDKAPLPDAPPKPPRAPRADKNKPRQPPNAEAVLSKRLDWVKSRLAALEPEFTALRSEYSRLTAALKSYAEAEANATQVP